MRTAPSDIAGVQVNPLAGLRSAVLGVTPRRLGKGAEMEPRAFLAAVQRARDTLPFGKRPTDQHVRIAAKLAFWRSPTPTHRALARAAKCSRRTVVRALARLRDLGLLSWQPRTVSGRGWAVRVSNLYAFSAATVLSPIRIHSSATLSHPAAAAEREASLRASAARALAAWNARRVNPLPPPR